MKDLINKFKNFYNYGDNKLYFSSIKSYMQINY